MGNPNEFDGELLSAYLDDALEGSERSRAEHLLATDPRAARYFSQLRSTRECLKSVPSSKLRSSLTARVLEQARAQALAAGLPSDHHVLRATATAEVTATPQDAATLTRTIEPAAVLPLPVVDLDRATASAVQASSVSSAASVKVAETAPQTIPSAHDRRSMRAQWSPRSDRIMWSILAAVAAAIGGLAVLPLLMVDRPGDVVAEHGPSEPATQQQATSAQTHSAENGAESASPFESVAANDAREPAVTVDGAAGSGNNRPSDNPGGVAHVMQGEGALDALKDDLVPRRPAFDFLMIIDAVASTEAWENERFEKLLEELGIPIVSPIVADKDLFTILEETRVVVGSAKENAADEQPRAALVFLRADGATLDRLHQAMHQDRQSFPQIVTDVSIDSADPKSALLHKLLRGQSAGQAQRGPSARVLATSGDVRAEGEVVPDFVPAQRRKMVSSDRTPAPSVANLSGLSLGKEGPMSEVLVILRQPSSK